MTDILRVDIWSDIACPWCYIGKRRFAAGLAQFAEQHPEIVFEATGFEPGMENGGRLDGRLSGNLTLLGQTHPVVLEVTLNKAATYPFGHRKHTLGISARTTIERSRWGMDYGVSRGMVGDAVQLGMVIDERRRPEEIGAVGGAAVRFGCGFRNPGG